MADAGIEGGYVERVHPVASLQCGHIHRVARLPSQPIHPLEEAVQVRELAADTRFELLDLGGLKV